MNIIEKVSIAKTGNEKDNEDSFVITDSFISVIDGMTPQDRSLYHGESPAQIAVNLITKEIESFPRIITYKEAAERLTNCIREYYLQQDILKEVSKHPYKRMGVNLIILSKERQEIWLMGDCHCLIDGLHVTNEKIIDHLIGEMRSQLIHKYLLKYSIEDLMERDYSREDIQPFLIQQYLYQNNQDESPLSYTVVDGFPMNYENIKVVKLKGATTIVLASDGYPLLCDSLKVTETQLKKLLRNDPLMYTIFKSAKGLIKRNISFDDRTYIKVLM
ncbi:hypothetical protein [Bacillus salipaludis]|uniref:PPM-type phosphatase domain-containing protein n=1 Tax=Bacillus salipaludis TaxID=2547811 RepID=A0ABW8RQ96_9BACI